MKRHLTLTDLSGFPLFIRFDNVRLYYWKKCELSETYLTQLKPALKDANMIEFLTQIFKDDPTGFADHSTFLDYLQNQLFQFQICDSARGYKFDFWSEANANTNVIESSNATNQALLKASNRNARTLGSTKGVTGGGNFKLA